MSRTEYWVTTFVLACMLWTFFKWVFGFGKKK